jgi:hypothetical protein
MHSLSRSVPLGGGPAEERHGYAGAVRASGGMGGPC